MLNQELIVAKFVSDLHHAITLLNILLVFFTEIVSASSFFVG